MTRILLVFFILTVGFLLSACAPKVAELDEGEWAATVESAKRQDLYAKHVNDEGLFFNPWMTQPQPKGGGGFFRMFRYWVFSKKFEPDFPREKYKAVANNYDYLLDPKNQSISFVGHASFIIKLDGETVLTDPFFSKKALLVGKEVKIKFDFEKLTDKPVVLISHNHYDHLDKWTIKKLIKKDAIFIAPLGMKKFFTKLGAKEVYELDWWESLKIGALTYTFLPAQHWSRRLGYERNSTLWGGFLIQGKKTIYFSGDSGYFIGYKEFGRLYKIDYALLGAGAYIPRAMMHYSHQNVSEFFKAARDLGAKKSIPMHFGIIRLGREPINYPLYEIEMYLEENPSQKDAIEALKVGQYLEVSSD